MADKRDGKRKYGEAYEAIRKILNEIDPVGLNVSGAPSDEYDPEVTRIVPLLNRQLSEAQLAQEIHLIFEESFGNCEMHNKLWNDIATQISALKLP